MGVELGQSQQRIHAARRRLRRGWGKAEAACDSAPADQEALADQEAPAVQGPLAETMAVPVAGQMPSPQVFGPPAPGSAAPEPLPEGTPDPANPIVNQAVAGPVDRTRRSLVGASVFAGLGVVAGSLVPGLLGPGRAPSETASGSGLSLDSQFAPAAGGSQAHDPPLASADGPQQGPLWPRQQDLGPQTLEQQELGLQYASSPLPRHSNRRPERRLALYNENTGETVRATFWAGGDYVIEELDAVHRLLRDHHVDEIVAIDLKLLEILHGIQSKLESKQPFHILSAYRSPRTNARLSRIYDGVAVNSFHIQGRALDLRLPGHSKRILLRAARALRGGGVGSYRSYIHIDTGPVRYW